jgi:putative endonuclease
MTNQELGVYGEQLAFQYLSDRNYVVVERNYRFGHLEADIICRHAGKLIVVEVKTRQTAEIGEPWRAVTRSKQRQIIKVTNEYIFSNAVNLETQFDIISIVHNNFRTDIEHIQDAFTP